MNWRHGLILCWDLRLRREVVTLGVGAEDDFVLTREIGRGWEVRRRDAVAPLSDDFGADTGVCEDLHDNCMRHAAVDQ